MMKKLFLIILILMPMLMLASTLTTVIEDPTVNFLTLTLEYAKFTFLAMLILAANHIVAGTFVFSIWWRDSLLPALLAFGGGLAVAALDIYATSWDFFIEGVLGATTDYTDFTNLALTGVVLVAFIKGIFKIGKTQAKEAARKASL